MINLSFPNVIYGSIGTGVGKPSYLCLKFVLRNQALDTLKKRKEFDAK